MHVEWMCTKMISSYFGLLTTEMLRLQLFSSGHFITLLGRLLLFWRSTNVVGLGLTNGTGGRIVERHRAAPDTQEEEKEEWAELPTSLSWDVHVERSTLGYTRTNARTHMHKPTLTRTEMPSPPHRHRLFSLVLQFLGLTATIQTFRCSSLSPAWCLDSHASTSSFLQALINSLFRWQKWKWQTQLFSLLLYLFI